MTRTIISLVLLAGFTDGACGQSSDTPAAFEAPDIHVSAKAPNTYMTTLFRGGRYRVRKATMLDLIRVAYGVDSDRIFGGPGWLETDRFDLIAKARRIPLRERSRDAQDPLSGPFQAGGPQR